MTSIYNFDSLVDRAYDALHADPTKTAEATQILTSEVNRSTSWFTRVLFWINPFTSIDSRIKAAVKTAQDAIAGINSDEPNYQFNAILHQHLGDDRPRAKVGKLWAAYKKALHKEYKKIAALPVPPAQPAPPVPPSLEKQFKSKYPNVWKEFQSMLSQMLYHKLKTEDSPAQEVFRDYLERKEYSDSDIDRMFEFARIQSLEQFQNLYPGLLNGWIEFYSSDLLEKMAEVDHQDLDKIYYRILFFNNKDKIHLYLRDRKGFTDKEIEAFLEVAKTQPKPTQSIEACTGKILRYPPPIAAVFGPLDDPDTVARAQRIEQMLDQQEFSDGDLVEIVDLSNKIKEQQGESPAYFRNALLSAHLPLPIRNCIHRKERIHQIASLYVARRFSESVKDRTATQPKEQVKFDKTEKEVRKLDEYDYPLYAPFIEDSHRLCPIHFNGETFEKFKFGEVPLPLLKVLRKKLKDDDLLFAQCILSTNNINAAAEIFTQHWEARPESREFPMRPVLKELFLHSHLERSSQLQSRFVLDAYVELQLTDPHTAGASHNSPPIASHEALVTYEFRVNGRGEWFRSEPKWSLINEPKVEVVPAAQPPLEQIEQVPVPDAEAVADLLSVPEVDRALIAPPNQGAESKPELRSAPYSSASSVAVV